jgi:ribose transport system permease protein
MNIASRVTRVLSIEGVAILGAFVLMVLYFSFSSDSFFVADSIRYYVNEAAPIFLITAGLTYVIIAGGIDLSIGAVLGLSAGTSLTFSMWGWPTWASALIGIATGLLFGVINAAIITFFKVNDFIVTLGTLNIAGGLLTVLTDHKQLVGTSDKNFMAIAGTMVFGVTTGIVIAILAVVVLEFALLKSSYGRRVYATGIGRLPAFISGIDVDKVKFQAYVISGGMAGLGGVVLAAHLNSVQSGLAGGYELTAIAGAVLGGVSLSGGRGSIWRAVVGALFLATLKQGLQLLGVDPLIYQIITGLCILIGVVLDRSVYNLALRISGRNLERNHQATTELSSV